MSDEAFALYLARGRTCKARPKRRRIIETTRAAVHKVRGVGHPVTTRLPKLFHRWVPATKNQWFTCVARGDVWRGRGGTAAGCFPNRTPPPRVMSVDVGEDAVELVEAVVADHQLALAPGRMLDRNLCAKLLSQFLF